MADDHADGAVVHGVVGVHRERGRLQDPGREHDLVEQRVVIRVGGRRRHAPAAAVHRLADGREVVANAERRCAATTLSQYDARVIGTLR